MPMIDIVAPEGTFSEANESVLLEKATAVLLKWEKTAGISLAVQNTGAYLHVLPRSRVAAGGKSDRVVRVQLLTPVNSLNQEQRTGITAGITEAVAELAVDPHVRDRTWVLFVEAVDGGWGIAGTAYTNAAIGAAVRASAAAR